MPPRGNNLNNLVTPVVDTDEDAPGASRAGGGTVRALTQRLLELAVSELHQPHSQQRVKDSIIDPLIRMLYKEMFPYVMVVCAVMLVILLTSLSTCTMFAMFFFTAKAPSRGSA